LHVSLFRADLQTEIWMDLKHAASVIRRAREQGRDVLLETEGAEILSSLGISVPQSVFVKSSVDPALGRHVSISSDRVVVKVISPDILHKTEVGGVRIIPNDKKSIVTSIAEMEIKFKSARVEGYTINEFISYSPALGREILLGMRWTEDFGPVVTFGPGGVYAELLAKNLIPGREFSAFSPYAGREDGAVRIEKGIRKTTVSGIISGEFRNQEPLAEMRALVAVVETFLAASSKLMPEDIGEFEINPLVISGGRFVALDVLIKLRNPGATRTEAGRPLEKIRNLLEPRSVAIIGVSEKMNPGRIILQNLISNGFERDRIFIVKPGVENIDGCRCVPDVAALPERVDLFILGISASQVPDVILDTIEYEKAESIIVIPGGLEEKQGTESIVSEMNTALAGSRNTKWGGPLINGGNCLGIRSIPGRYNTLFIPGYKLPMPSGKTSSLALVSQSGAFAISRMNKLQNLNPRFTITVGNQMDLTIGDYLEYLSDDESISVFAVYVEGFRPLDGIKFLRAAERIIASGRRVVLYRAGRTSAGARASASHTASIAGDYPVTREFCTASGIILASDIEEFEDLVRICCQLGARIPRGRRLGAVSNAGCECVAMADNLGGFDLAVFSRKTDMRLKEIFKETGISEIVDVHNPLDLTPMAGDAAYEQSIVAVLEDEGVDAAVVGVVPLSPALSTLAAASAHKEDLKSPGAVASRLKKAWEAHTKPWVVVVDAGAQYDQFVAAIEEAGIPVFRAADRALKIFNIFCFGKTG